MMDIIIFSFVLQIIYFLNNNIIVFLLLPIQ